MTAAAAAVRPARPAGPPIAAPATPALTLAIAALALCGAAMGVSLALGELDALYIGLSVIACAAVLFDFRIGTVLLVLLLPVEPTSYFPHSVGGVTGLNPINLLEAATLVSFLARWKLNRAGEIAPPRLFWMYVLPIVIAGLIGAPHVHEIPAVFFEEGLAISGPGGYLRDFMLKPLTMVLVALLLAGAVAKSKKPERFLLPIFAAIWIMSLLAILYAALSGVSLSELASASDRGFFSGVGMHANDLGRLYAVAYALVLFTWWETKSGPLRVALLATMGLIALALLLTFSRGAFLGFVLVNGLFLLWKFNMRTLALALLAAIVAALLMPGAVYDRLMLGFGGGGDFNDVSAGRLDGIWLPLLPELFKSPIWGSGLSSTMWSYAMKNGLMLVVGHPHNAYMEAVLDTGLVGLGLLCAYFWHVWKGFRALGSNAFLSPELRGFFQGAAAGLVSFAVTGWAGSSLVPKPEYAFLWLAIGMMYGTLARKPAA